MASPNNADQKKQCRYHQNSKHSTEECQTLKDKIKELIQVGHLVGSLGVAKIRGTPFAKLSPPKEGGHLREAGTTGTAKRIVGPEETTLHVGMIRLGKPKEGNPRGYQHHS